jgi:SNF2 family DNA or RNA helicase
VSSNSTKTGEKKMPCVKDEPLNATRQDIIRRLQTQHGLILAHDTGTGKTLSAITAAEQHPRARVLVLTPASLVSNFKIALLQYCVPPDLDPNRPRYTIMSYDLFLKSNVPCEGVFLICDEAHRLRSGGQTARKVMECAHNAFRVLLLTATPIVNSPSDTINLFAMAMNSDPIRPQAFEQLWRSKDIQSLRKYISFKHKNSSDFPNVRVHEVTLTMPSEYYDAYQAVERQQFRGKPASSIIKSDSDVFAFLSGIRRASNAALVVNNPKIDWIRAKVKQGGKFLIYSEWIKAGADLVRSAFPDAGFITGSMPMKDRDAIVRAYNSNQIKVLFVSGAGGEGLDLKGTTDVVIFEVPFHKAREQQVIGRAARYKSHDKPGSVVDVWKIVLQKPKKWIGSHRYLSADDWVLQLRRKKEQLNAEFERRLRGK